eukprot:SAG31_NODE_10688_length_1109_cov_1.394059_1_plen_85_part_10
MDITTILVIHCTTLIHAEWSECSRASEVVYRHAICRPYGMYSCNCQLSPELLNLVRLCISVYKYVLLREKCVLMRWSTQRRSAFV